MELPGDSAAADPLSREFDLLVLGTSLVPCVVAAAAAKLGLRVAHLDANGFYGGEDAALPLEQLRKLLNGDAEGEGDSAAAPSPAPELPLGTREQQPPPPRLQRLGARLRLHAGGGEPPADLAGAARRVCVDLQPRLTLSRGALTDVLVSSNVATYLEFRSLDAAFIVEVEAATAFTEASAGAGAATGPAPWRLQRLPSSKADVFGAPSLSLLDKRRLMKFLLFAQDLAHADGADDDVPVVVVATSATPTASANSGAGVGRLNEALLGAGRSLLRPQNKASPAYDLEAFGGRSLREFLEHGAGLPPGLRDLVAYAVALQELPDVEPAAAGAKAAEPALSAAAGLRRVRAHVAALGRFGGGCAFIASLYGSGELPQAFCRLCAVHGGLYMLRQSVATWLVRDGGVGKGDAEGECGGGREGATAATAGPRCVGVRTADGTVVRARCVLAASEYLPALWRSPRSPARALPLVVAVCLARGALAGLGSGNAPLFASSPEAAAPELVHIVVPPRAPPTLHARAVYVLQQGPGSCVVPHATAGQAALSLRLVHVVTRAASCGVADVDVAVEALQRTVEHLFMRAGATERGNERPELAWHSVFSLAPPESGGEGAAPANVVEACADEGEGGEEGVGLDSLVHFGSVAGRARRLFGAVAAALGRGGDAALFFEEKVGVEGVGVGEGEGVGEGVEGRSMVGEERKEDRGGAGGAAAEVEGDGLNVAAALAMLQGEF